MTMSMNHMSQMQVPTNQKEDLASCNQFRKNLLDIDISLHKFQILV